MIATAHQPHFLPWLGYVNKAANADVFVWLDTVQYTKNNFQNRTRIIGTSGEEQWLTLPVRSSLDWTIQEIMIADSRWKPKVERTIEQSYSKAPFFDEYWPPLQAALHESSDYLSDVNHRLFEVVLRALDLDGLRLVRASDLDVETEDASERLAALCSAVGADCYISGSSGRKYLDREPFDVRGIEILFQDFSVGCTAHERSTGEVVKGLSIIDSLFHVGAERCLELARRGWVAPPR